LPRDLRSAPELSNEFQHVHALWIELRGRIPIRAFTEPRCRTRATFLQRCLQRGKSVITAGFKHSAASSR
jgi:hypothetical protein